jgi:hypothetical protein
VAKKVAVTPFIPPMLNDDTKSWASDATLALQQAFNQIGQRLNVVLPEDGSEAMTGPVRPATSTFANLPSSPTVPMIMYVSDSNTATWGATIAGGGTNKVLAWYNGVHWTVVGI